MKKLLGLLLVLALLLGCAGAEEAAAPALQKDVVILYTSDVHCGVNQNWGYAGVYAAKQYYSKDNYVLLVDDGDATQGEPIGTMTRGEGIIEIMNVVGYDLVIPGNHDFDYGMDTFMELTKKANFPYISCNFNKEGELIFPAYMIKEFDGVKIAFVGVTTPTTLRSSTPRYFMNEQGEFIYGFFQDETGDKLYNAVQKAVDDARGEGANYVILIAHLGNEAECSPWMYSEVIEHTSGIDAVLDGHSHDEEQVTVKNKEGKSVPRSAVGTKLNNIGVLTISKKDGSVSTKVLKCNSAVSVPDMTGLDNAASKEVAVETTLLNRKLATVVAKNTVNLITHDPDSGERVIRRAETNLGDLCADAYRDQAGNSDIAFVNGGGIRVSIDAGDVTLNNILTVNPFGNALTVIEVTGQQVLDALEWSVHAMPGEFGGFLQVSGLTFEFDPTIESPVIQDANGMFGGVDDTKGRRVRNVLVGGEPIDSAKIYTLASHDYMLLNNGDGYTMFNGAKVLQESVKLDNQVLIDYITETLGGVIGEGYDNLYGQGRIVSVTAGE